MSFRRATQFIDSGRTHILTTTEGTNDPLPGDAVALAASAIEEIKTALALCEAAVRHIESHPEFYATTAGG